MKLYLERLLDNGFLSVMGAFISSPLLVSSILYGLKVLMIWLVIWTIALLVSGFINPNHFAHGDTDGPMDGEIR